ncbi:MAG: GGDEF domain-containing protein [Eubacteriales bacterium]|nr:GGDEF domain-containing protein [Eubacteriales bacterium]
MLSGLDYSVLTADVLGVMLILTMYFSNRQRVKTDKDMSIIRNMMFICFFACVSDSVVYYFEGIPGIPMHIIMLICGSWLFLSNVLIGSAWVKFLTLHLNIPFSGTRKKVYFVLKTFGFLLLFINLFKPFVFTVEGNVYDRGNGYWIFLGIAIVFIVDSLVLYYRCRNKVGILKFFPVSIFLLPVIAGISIQVPFYEMSIIWPSVAIGLAGVLTALKNEVIYTDKLTGLYNRAYLEFLEERGDLRKNANLSGIMIDLNEFKEINDSYGHSVGDEALCIAGDIFNEAFGEYGVVMRYAGDEFVILLNTKDTNLIESLIDKANRCFEDYNATGKKPYRLSAAMGYAVADFSRESMDEFLNSIDSEMYKNKIAYNKTR